MSRAIAVLGMNTIRTIVMSLTFHAMVHARQRKSRFNRQEYWQHPLATAISGSRVLARLKRSKWDEEVFLAGLLHDVGNLPAAIRTGIACHHALTQAEKDLLEPAAPVHAANCLVNQAETAVYEPIRLVVAKEVIEAQAAFRMT